MQFLLTKQEFNHLSNQKDNIDKENIRLLQEVCTYAANNVPIKFWGREELQPWGCIMTSSQEWYCNECPVQQQCPHDNKEWSK